MQKTFEWSENQLEAESKLVQYHGEQIGQVKYEDGIPYWIALVRVYLSTFETWKKHSAFIQTSIDRRITWFKHMQKCLSTSALNKGRDKTFHVTENEFVQTVKIISKELLGNVEIGLISKGSHGDVYHAILANEVCKSLPISVKIQIFENSEDYRMSDFAIRCMEKTNSLLQSKKNINFPFMLANFVGMRVRENKNELISYTLMEYTDGNLADLMQSQTFGPEIVFSFYGQIVFAILEMAIQFRMIHEDLYLKNILYNLTDKNLKPEYQIPYMNPETQKLDDHQTMFYPFAASNMIVKLADFGFCSIQIDRDLPSPKYKQLTNWNEIIDTPISLFNNIPRYARDILTITLDFYKYVKPKASSKESSFVTLSLYFNKILNWMVKNLQQDAKFLTTPSHLYLVVQKIFSKTFLNEFEQQQLQTQFK